MSNVLLVSNVLREAWKFIRKLVEYYDDNPKSNLVIQVLDRMNDVFDAISCLMVLNKCYMEISTDSENEISDCDEEKEDEFIDSVETTEGGEREAQRVMRAHASSSGRKIL